jgi:uncharacterized heparinase superfamily protein
MLIEEMRDQWICSCGNWVGRQITWCPECCEDRVVHRKEERQEQEAYTAHMVTDTYGH